EQNTQLNTQVSIKLFNFLKPNLINFTPGKILKPASKDTPASKSNFKYLIKSMAGQYPDFLTDLIFNANPNIDKATTILFDIILSTFKSLLSKFTTILFTKLNYQKILSSYNSIPPYTIQNHNLFAINLIRIHFLLYDDYKTIHANKFF